MKTFLVLVLSLVFLTQCSKTKDQSKSPTNGQSQQSNGQTVRWDKHNISFTVPADWTKDTSLSREDEKRGDKIIDGFAWRGPQDQRFESIVETSDTDFPASIEEMLTADYESSKSGPVKLEDLRYLEINGMKGMYYRMPGDDSMNGNWITYRHYKGKAQLIGFTVHGQRKELEHLNSILSSVKIENRE